MASSHSRRSGAQVLIDQLRIHGTDTIFGVPGESYLAALDALYAQRNSMRFIICRQEGGAANMAEAYGKLTGKPGIAFVTRGPGATNASIGLHTGFQDSTPMILLVGQVAREASDREAFQEIDYRRMFGQMAKWVVQIEDARRIPELISQAFHTALNGRPGPVVIALPEDMLVDEVEVPDAGPYKIARGAPAPDDMAMLRELLAAAEKPMVIVGGGGWTAKAGADIRAFIEANDLPVCASFRNQDLFDNRHPNYAGDLGVGVGPALGKRLKACDLIIAVGPRLGEATTGGYTLFDQPGPLPGAVNMGEVIAWLNKRLPDDAIVTNGAGNYAAFLHRFFQYRGFKTQLAPTSGAMGYGVPAAVAAKIAEPDRMVVSLAGGGRFPVKRPG